MFITGEKNALVVSSKVLVALLICTMFSPDKLEFKYIEFKRYIILKVSRVCIMGSHAYDNLRKYMDNR